MRVLATGNLTVELIRAHRFEAGQPQLAIDASRQDVRCQDAHEHRHKHCVDRVELSPEALASDGHACDTKQVDPAHRIAEPTAQTSESQEPSAEPRELTPVVGSPALAGLGVALVVPGTLLDVLA